MALAEDTTKRAPRVRLTELKGLPTAGGLGFSQLLEVFIHSALKSGEYTTPEVVDELYAHTIGVYPCFCLFYFKDGRGQALAKATVMMGRTTHNSLFTRSPGCPCLHDYYAPFASTENDVMEQCVYFTSLVFLTIII